MRSFAKYRLAERSVRMPEGFRGCKRVLNVVDKGRELRERSFGSVQWETLERADYSFAIIPSCRASTS